MITQLDGSDEIVSSAGAAKQLRRFSRLRAVSRSELYRSASAARSAMFDHRVRICLSRPHVPTLEDGNQMLYRCAKQSQGRYFVRLHERVDPFSSVGRLLTEAVTKYQAMHVAVYGRAPQDCNVIRICRNTSEGVQNRHPRAHRWDPHRTTTCRTSHRRWLRRPWLGQIVISSPALVEVHLSGQVGLLSAPSIALHAAIVSQGFCASAGLCVGVAA